MMTFYAAIGTYRIRTENGHKVPYIQKLGKLYPISIPEFVIWSTLLWEVMTYGELKKHYDEQIRELKGNRPSFDELLSMLANDKHGNAPKDLSDWPYREWLEHQQATQGAEPLYRTFYALCMWLDVFYDCVDGRLMSFSEYRDNGRLSSDSLRRNLRRTAILNLKKTWGGGATAWSALNSYLESKVARDVIQKQIELIQPNIVICGGQQVFDLARMVFGAAEELLPTGDRDILYFKFNGALFLNFYHPACRKSREFLYYYSAGVFQTLLEKGLC